MGVFTHRFRARVWFPIATAVCVLALNGFAASGSSDAQTYRAAVAKLNDAHAAKPGDADEADLAKKLPKSAVAALERLLADPQADPADLVLAGEAALDLDRLADFEAVRARLVESSPDAASQLGIALSRPRFLLRGTDGVEMTGLTAIADALDRILDAYADVFHFTAWSKVPGKKLRVRAHLVEKIERPPHFAPQFPWHSEIDFPVVSKDSFSSPTSDGKFQFYGLCHELGHVIAMWGDRSNEADHHAWAHYTGVVIVEHLARTAKDSPALRDLRDAKWRTLTLERAKLAEKSVAPGLTDRDAVMALFAALHEEVGPATIGDALNALDKAGKHQLVNRVRYYALKDLAQAILATPAGRAQAKRVAAWFADAR